MSPANALTLLALLAAIATARHVARAVYQHTESAVAGALIGIIAGLVWPLTLIVLGLARYVERADR